MKLNQYDDSQLMKYVQRGNKEAFVVIMQRHQQNLLNFFIYMGIYIDEAEEMVQETFLRLYNYRQRYRPIARFTTFLYTLAKNIWRDRMRKIKHKNDFDKMVKNNFGKKYLPLTETQLDILDAISQLSEKLRLVVVLNIYHGLRYQEIAKVLNIPEGSVKSRMFMALRQLKEKLNIYVEPK